MDVVGQGREEPSHVPRWLRRGGFVAALAVGAFLVLRPGLLNADPPAPEPAPTPSSQAALNAENTSQGVSIVVRRGNRLERYEAGSGRRPLATLPRDLPLTAPLVHVPGRRGTGPLLGVHGTVLFRANPTRDHPLAGIGRAQRIVGPSISPRRALVIQPFGGRDNGPRLVEVVARTGALTDPAPYPGYPIGGPWQPVGVIEVFGGAPLLLSRPDKDGGVTLALAWDRASVSGNRAAPLAPIGRTGRLLGVAQDRLLTLDPTARCQSRGCPVTVVTVTRNGLLRRPVLPPSGWRFGTTMVAGDEGDPLVMVSRVGDPSRLALARLAAGANSGLLIAGSPGLVGSVPPAGGAEGSVVFVVPRPEGLRLSVWRPGARSAAILLDLPALEDDAQLVCACR